MNNDLGHTIGTGIHVHCINGSMYIDCTTSVHESGYVYVTVTSAPLSPQLPLPKSNALPREAHSAASISTCPHVVEVVMFGGCPTTGESGFDNAPKMAETTVLLLGK